MKFLDHEKRRQLLNERHSCKMFDSHYEFSSTELEEIAEIARLSPSSYNTQPWHFVMVTKVGEILEQRINKPKIVCLIALGKRVAEASKKSRKSKIDAITWL
ncbi:nitroreductase family protein [Helicobacter pylori]|nr:nitroreductase family protein [Helicobacter pylori]